MNPSGAFVDHTLPNGLRIVIEPMPQSHSAAAGFLVRTGARDEQPELAGVSHFLEHMCFKGTPKRSWEQITVDFDNMGSTYNAYTSKEKTFYFGWVRVEDLERQVELIADMMRSTLPPGEFDTEKKVILEEIAMSDDQIDRQVYEFLHEKIYAGHPLAWPVLGTAATVSSLTRDQMNQYFESRYHPANMILLVAGDVNPQEVIAMAQRICGDWKPRAPRPQRAAPPPIPEGIAVSTTDRFQQQALAICFPAPSAIHPDRETADVMASILGGHNSRFFWNIVQTGIAPHISAGRMEYCDAGMMMVFGFCEPAKAQQLLEAIRKEIEDFTKKGVTADEVERVKNRTRTGLATEAYRAWIARGMSPSVSELSNP
jgi:predicted Zn-dependent peptidase